MVDRQEVETVVHEEWKWMGSPVWSRDGMIAVGNAWRAIDLFAGDKINGRALKNLVRAAVDYNQIKLKSKAPAGTRAKVYKSKK
jgi:hypothetical protein